MKQALALVILLLILGVSAFAYRYEVEKPTGMNPTATSTTATSTNGIACTADAKVCPDGSAVGRTAPNCTFTACPSPNTEITNGSTTISFVLPAGYKQVEQGAQAQYILRTYQKPTTTGSQNHALVISAFPIGAGQSASSVMLTNTIFDPSGMQATSTSQFKQVTIGSHTFYSVLLGRFEGQVESAYYLPTTNTVYKFDIVERGITNWTDANLNVSALPQHQALMQMLATLQVGS